MTDRRKVCGDDGPDLRHVGIECFYDVQEVVPEAEQLLILRPIPDDKSYWGRARRYPPGERSQIVVDHAKTKEAVTDNQKTPTTHMKTEWTDIPAINLQEVNIYSIRCCKGCRADFLGVLKRWHAGEFRADEDEGNIPVRVNGTTKMVTVEQW